MALITVLLESYIVNSNRLYMQHGVAFSQWTRSKADLIPR